MKRFLQLLGAGLALMLIVAAGAAAYTYFSFSDLRPDRGPGYQARMHYLPDPDPDTRFDMDGFEGWSKRLLHNALIDQGPYLVAYPLTEGEAKPAVVILPGGGYMMRAEKHEGVDVAQWLNSQGYAAFVLNYRLQQHPVPISDVESAFTYLRSRAAEFNIRSDKLGVLGFSAGGHLAATAATLLRGDSRPDFAVLAYPTLHMEGPLHCPGCRRSLLGENPSQAQIDLLSPARQITPQTPPMFIWAPKTDEAVPWENSQVFSQALNAAGIANELHIFDQGEHGSGLAQHENEASAWPDLMIGWLNNL